MIFLDDEVGRIHPVRSVILHHHRPGHGVISAESSGLVSVCANDEKEGLDSQVTVQGFAHGVGPVPVLGRDSQPSDVRGDSFSLRSSMSGSKTVLAGDVSQGRCTYGGDDRPGLRSTRSVVSCGRR